MERRLMHERMAYEETKERLAALRRKIKKLRKRNRRAALTEKKIDFLINNDFQKWTNSFARKSVLWENSKQALLGDRTVDHSLIAQQQREKSPERCCGNSP